MTLCWRLEMQCILLLLNAFPSLSFNFLYLTWRALLSRCADPASTSQVPKQCSSSSVPRYSSCYAPAGFLGGPALPIFGDSFDLYRLAFWNMRRAGALFAHLEKFNSANFSSSLVIRVNLPYPWSSFFLYGLFLSLQLVFLNNYFQVSFNSRWFCTRPKFTVAELPTFEFPTNFLLTDKWNDRHLGCMALAYVKPGSRKNSWYKKTL